MSATSHATSLEWYALFTRSRHEQAVRRHLEQENIEAFLPTIARWSRWKDRRKQIEWPLFPGYCFAKFDAARPLPVLKCAGVLSIVSIAGAPVAVDESDLRGVRLLCERQLDCDPCPLIPEGALVEITRGPLEGVTGRLLEKNATKATVVLSVALIGQAVRVTVDASDITSR